MLSQDLIKSSLEDIASDEIQKFKYSYQSETFGNSKFFTALDDAIWEYNGLHEAYQGDCEEMLLEMQRIFYEDLRMEETKGERLFQIIWNLVLRLLLGFRDLLSFLIDIIYCI